MTELRSEVCDEAQKGGLKSSSDICKEGLLRTSSQPHTVSADLGTLHRVGHSRYLNRSLLQHGVLGFSKCDSIHYLNLGSFFFLDLGTWNTVSRK